MAGETRLLVARRGAPVTPALPPTPVSSTTDNAAPAAVTPFDDAVVANDAPRCRRQK